MAKINEFGTSTLFVEVDDSAMVEGLKRDEQITKVATAKMQASLDTLSIKTGQANQASAKFKGGLSGLSTVAAVTGSTMVGTAANVALLGTEMGAMGQAAKAAGSTLLRIGGTVAAAIFTPVTLAVGAVVALTVAFRNRQAISDWAFSMTAAGRSAKEAEDSIVSLNARLNEQADKAKIAGKALRDNLAVLKLKGSGASSLEVETLKAKQQGFGSGSGAIANLRVESELELKRQARVAKSLALVKEIKNKEAIRLNLKKQQVEVERKLTEEANKQFDIAFRLSERSRISGGTVRTGGEAGQFIRGQELNQIRQLRSRQLTLENLLGRLQRGSISNVIAASIAGSLGVGVGSSGPSGSFGGIDTSKFTNIGSAISQLGQTKGDRIQEKQLTVLQRIEKALKLDRGAGP